MQTLTCSATQNKWDQTGQVQDTISSMTQRQNNKSSPRIALIIPAQQAPHSGSFPTSSKAVSRWLSASGGGGIDARVSALITALKHSNRLQNTPTERLKILDIFIAEFQQLLPDLRARYAGNSFPQTPSAEDAFSKTALLLHEVSYGYKISLVDRLLGRGTLTQKVRVHTIYRAIKAIGDCGLHHSLGYRKWPTKSWRDLNTLLLLAEHEKAHEIPINTGSAQNYPETIQGLYIGYSLLQASDTQQLQKHEISALFSTLCHSAGKFRLTKIRDRSSATLNYSVALDSANAPTPDWFCNYPHNANLRFLSLEPLVSLFSSGLRSDQLSSHLGHAQQRKLNQNWLQTSMRRSPRAIRNINLFGQCGLAEIAETLHAASNQRRHSDLFSTQWIIRNQSAGGIGLQAGFKDSQRINIGEAIAYGAVQSGSGHKPWCQLGVIRWLSNESQKPINFGVETIAECTECVTLNGKDQNQNEPDRTALIGMDPYSTGSEVILLVSRKRYEPGESITISVAASSRYQNCITTIGDLIDQRGNFDCFKLSSTPLR